MRLGFFSWALCVCVCGAAGVVGAAERAGGGKLAYEVQSSHGRVWIAATTIDGARVRQLVRPSRLHEWRDFSWSPDGRELVASSDEIVVARDGGESRIVVPTIRRTSFEAVRWSPKGD